MSAAGANLGPSREVGYPRTYPLRQDFPGRLVQIPVVAVAGDVLDGLEPALETGPGVTAQMGEHAANVAAEILRIPFVQAGANAIP